MVIANGDKGIHCPTWPVCQKYYMSGATRFLQSGAISKSFWQLFNSHHCHPTNHENLDLSIPSAFDEDEDEVCPFPSGGVHAVSNKLKDSSIQQHSSFHVWNCCRKICCMQIFFVTASYFLLDTSWCSIGKASISVQGLEHQQGNN